MLKQCWSCAGHFKCTNPKTTFKNLTNRDDDNLDIFEQQTIYENLKLFEQGAH